MQKTIIATLMAVFVGLFGTSAQACGPSSEGSGKSCGCQAHHGTANSCSCQGGSCSANTLKGTGGL